MINPYLLEQLLAFYRTGPLSAAADELFISQPALSQSMQKLEELVGVSLFNRQKNKTTFNDNGILLANYAERILALQAEMLDKVRSQALHPNHLSLAAIGPGPLIKLETYMKEHLTNLDLNTDLLEDEDQLFDGLMQDRYDVIISHRIQTDDRVIALPYFSETLYMRLPATHPLAKRKTLTFADLAGQNILLLSAIGFWRELVRTHIPTANYLYMENSEAFSDIARMGAFPSFITDLHDFETSDDYTIVPIDEPLATAHFSFVTKKEQYDKWDTLLKQLLAQP